MSTPRDINDARLLYLDVSDTRLDDFACLNLDVEAIVVWANCPNQNARRNRIRFVGAFPVLVPMLVWKPDDPFSSAIIGWIDDGEPLAENIACLMGDVPPDVVGVSEFLCKRGFGYS